MTRASAAALLYNDLHVVQNLEVNSRRSGALLASASASNSLLLQACACGSALQRSGLLSYFDEEDRKMLRRLRISLTMVRWMPCLTCDL